MKLLLIILCIIAIASGSFETYKFVGLTRTIEATSKFACKGSEGIKSITVEQSTIQYKCNEKGSQEGYPFY